MTTWQRATYFLNEWAVAIIGLCVLSAVLVFLADKTDWKTPAWVVAGGLACCAPFWLWKVFSVRRSIERTSAMSFQQGVVSGDVHGWSPILSQPPTISAQPPATPPASYQAPKKGISLGWKIRLGFIVVGIIVAVLDDQWKTIDKYFPQLNKVIHSGTPTSGGDIDYLVGHMQQDERELSEGCPDNMKFKECRAHFLAKKPALDDLHQQVQALADAWAKEKSERTVPADCQNAMRGMLTAYNQYLSAEDEAFAVLGSIDPDSVDNLRASQARIHDVTDKENTAVTALHNNAVGNACSGY